MTERVTNLGAPPVLGRWYLVPTVAYPYLGETAAWPVFLPKHEDRTHLDFEWDHYHVDPRFVQSRRWARAKAAGRGWQDWPSTDEDAFSYLQRAPLHRLDDKGLTIAHPPVVWRKMRCARVEIPYQHGFQPTIKTLRQTFGGQQCKRARSGWVCPHKNVPLGGVAPDDDGIIVCPLHGLRIDAATGVVRHD